MPYSVEVQDTSSAPPEVVFQHLAVAEAWGVWGRFPVKAKQERPGDETRNGVGAVKAIWPAREQTVAYEPPKHFAYIALRGLPTKHYRSDVHLEPSDNGTRILWRSEFEPLVPGTGPAIKAFLGWMLRTFARQVSRHSEQCRSGCPAHPAAT